MLKTGQQSGNLGGSIYRTVWWAILDSSRTPVWE